jgi:hypothetical protein
MRQSLEVVIYDIACICSVLKITGAFYFGLAD